MNSYRERLLSDIALVLAGMALMMMLLAGCGKWSTRWQCRDFARAFATFAQLAHTNTLASRDADALAVGETWFLPNPDLKNDGHAVCPVICDQGLVFIEPQTGERYPMTEPQRATAYFLRF